MGVFQNGSLERLPIYLFIHNHVANGGGPVQQRCEKEYEQVQAQKQSGEGSVWDSKILSKGLNPSILYYQ